MTKKYNGSKKMRREKTDTPTVRLISHNYQPSRAELEEDLRIDASLEELGKAVTRTVRLEFHKPQRSSRR